MRNVSLVLCDVADDLPCSDDEPFTSYTTPQYKLHLFETPTGYKFVLLSDPTSDSLRFILRQLYMGPFLEYVVRNPLVNLDSREEGIDNDQVRHFWSLIIRIVANVYDVSSVKL